jgi:putative transposase
VTSRLFLPKLGWLRFRKRRGVLGALKSIPLSRSGDKWFASVQTEREVERPIHAGGTVGIDVGNARFVTLSDGTHYESLNSFKRHEVALRKPQQSMGRKGKFGKNWRNAKAIVQRIHSRIGNARRGYLHKVSTLISKNHAVVCIEDLHVQNMSKERELRFIDVARVGLGPIAPSVAFALLEYHENTRWPLLRS